MKNKIIALVFGALVLPTSASITLSAQFGAASNTSGVAVPDGTLWALVVDTNSDNLFPGAFGANQSLGETGALTTFTPGQQLTIGGNLLGGDTVFALGRFNGTANGVTGLAIFEEGYTLGTNGLVAGKQFAFYWFPGSTYTSSGTNVVGSAVGGINTGADAAAGLGGMVVPSEGAFYTTGAATTGAAGGSLSASRFLAQTLVPEPSSALLGAIGSLGLLRRRRN